jgi:hypothetical protein
MSIRFFGGAILAATVSATSVACAQGPGQRLSVEVTPTAIEATGDTVRVTYSIKNSPTSQEPVFVFSLDVPMGAVRMTAPGDPEDWSLGRMYRGKKVAEWGVLGHQLYPGMQVDGLTYAAVGVIGLTTATVGGNFPPLPVPSEAEQQANPELGRDPDPRVAQAIHFPLPGIVPTPDGGPTAILSTLINDRTAACANAIGARRGTCRSLEAKLQAASASLGRDNANAATGQLGAFVNELEALGVNKTQFGQSYWLLLGNAKALIARLGGS